MEFVFGDHCPLSAQDHLFGLVRIDRLYSLGRPASIETSRSKVRSVIGPRTEIPVFKYGGVTHCAKLLVTPGDVA